VEWQSIFNLIVGLDMTLHKTIAALLTCALASAQTPQLLSQQDQDRRVVIRINVNLVQVDAVVTDSHDNPVTDLTADDFIVLQDGKTQEITNFSYVRTHEAPVSFTAAEISQARASGTSAVPPAPPMLMKPQKVRRTIALVVDDLGLSFEGTVRVREALRKWIDEEMQP
jgi:VWFA-related protein